MSIDLIALWHERVRSRPTPHEFNVQLGCHFEEFVEMLATLELESDGAEMEMPALITTLQHIAGGLKRGEISAAITDRKEFLDSIADQVVTGIGAAYCARMSIVEAIRRVNHSNWTKFEDGRPVFDAYGKVTKPPTYQPPNLQGLY